MHRHYVSFFPPFKSFQIFVKLPLSEHFGRTFHRFCSLTLKCICLGFAKIIFQNGLHLS